MFVTLCIKKVPISFHTAHKLKNSGIRLGFLICGRSKVRGTLLVGFESRSGPHISRCGSEN